MSTLRIALLLVLLVACAGTESATRDEPTPNVDRDGDMILDRCDECPDQPEPYNLTLDDDGCPDSVVVTESRHAVVRSVYFPGASEAPGDVGEEQLALLVDELGAAHAESVLCVGESAEGEEEAESLARRRAERACERLKRAGAAQRTEVVGHGVREADDPAAARRVTVYQLDSRLVEQWYAPLYVFAQVRDGELALVEALEEDAPTGPPRCPGE